MKAVDCTASSPLQDKLAALEPLYSQYSVYVLCEALDVPRGTFYNYILRNKRSNSSYAKHREEMRLQIKRVYDENHQIFGARKIQAILQSEGYRVSEKFIAELMREMGLNSIRTTAKKDYEKLWAKKENRNVLQQQFNVDFPNKVWVSDVTCYSCNNTNFYICVIIDLCSRRIVSYRISKKNSTQLTTATFKAAYQERNPEEGLIFHSDRGSQYSSHAFGKLLNDNHVVQSLSAPGNPHDNAVAESFFASLKKEALFRRDFRSEAEFKEGVREYIRFYNYERPHTSLKYRTPVQVESMFAQSVTSD